MKAVALPEAIDALTRVPETWHGAVYLGNHILGRCQHMGRCHHKHRTRRAAQLCAAKMMRALEKR